jgi:hypothetical protein
MAATVAASIGVLGVWTLINLRRIDEIGWINNAAAIFQLSASFVMLVVLLGATTQYATLDFFTQVPRVEQKQRSFQPQSRRIILQQVIRCSDTHWLACIL